MCLCKYGIYFGYISLPFFLFCHCKLKDLYAACQDTAEQKNRFYRGVSLYQGHKAALKRQKYMEINVKSSVIWMAYMIPPRQNISFPSE